MQNILLLIASYIFYSWVSWKILPLLIISTIVFYILGIAVFKTKTERKKRLLYSLGIVFGVGVLLYFKYFNFFISSVKELLETIGLQTNLHTIKIIIPIGISFYTFRLLSYIIDIYQEEIEPTYNFIDFATYIAFFPCILAGPIDRPATLIPQLQNKRVFSYLGVVDGLRQILWGLFKKAVIADNLVGYVNQVFDGDIHLQTGSTLLFAAMLALIQLYADFSGYSDMATGIAKVLGFNITKNFDYPLFSQNVAEFWRRWHLSFTTWLTDYIFMPLNFIWRKWGKWGMILAITVNFVICGLWHGDRWTFILWGAYNGLLFIPLILSGAMYKPNIIETYYWGIPKPKVIVKMFQTFILMTLGMVFFRSESLSFAVDYFSKIFSVSILSIPKIDIFSNASIRPAAMFGLIFFFILMEWAGRNQQYAIERLGFNLRRPLRWSIYALIIFLLGIYMKTSETPFVYFQF
ncbi:MAG: MBOAT family protein [Chitinophagales bacterium]|nr:MBOAT family protein [Chitinophagales bacterium]